MSLGLPWTFRYRDDGYGPAPLIPVSLQLANYAVDLYLVLDTGAERTLLEGVHLRAAGLDVFDGVSQALQGFTGARSLAYLHRATLSIGEMQIEADVAFSTQPLLRQVLGRDLLDHFIVGLRERAGEFYMGPDPLLKP